MIKVKDANKSYAKKRVLDQLSLTLESGKAYGLLGGNGVGKSTLIKGIMGLISLDSGSIETKGRLSFLPEQAYLPENMTAWQLITFACQMQNCKLDDAAALLEEVDLDKNAWHKKISQYSKGMKQRTAIAYALAGSPDWLILDEPMSGLDAMGRLSILNVFKQRHKRGTGILMCSHVVTDMVRLCDAVCILAKGDIQEKIDVVSNSMSQAIELEERLRYWSDHEVLA